MGDIVLPKWKQIIEFPDYWISDTRVVMNLSTSKLISPRKKDGVWYVNLKKSQSEHARRYPVRVSHLMENYWGVSNEHQAQKEQS